MVGRLFRKAIDNHDIPMEQMKNGEKSGLRAQVVETTNHLGGHAPVVSKGHELRHGSVDNIAVAAQCFHDEQMMKLYQAE